ncbi:MAG: hypothetical protein AW10_02832 [Candidatus Accumulibacter appositus]|uniref:Uncharacterized protein n=1 Tax=Candidatus Accumulibacter appositus TaxID=1454003 RepID=A0A011N7U6_9PROT|nr:MAG: hypothetical protein AW10_02832 [Candidatus Accumulibacter appositus]
MAITPQLGSSINNAFRALLTLFVLESIINNSCSYHFLIEVNSAVDDSFLCHLLIIYFTFKDATGSVTLC